MYCLDANVWIYYLDTRTDEHESVVDTISDIVEDEPIFTTTVLQMEVVHYLHTQLTDPDELLDRFLFLEETLVAELRREDIEAATELLGTYPNTGIGGRDATVLAAMRRYDVSHLWTHDNGLKRVGADLEWLEVTDPVAEQE